MRAKGEDKSTVLPRRPAYGSQGQALLVWTNYFALDLKAMTLYRYAIKVKKNNKETARNMAKRIIQQLIQDKLKELDIDAVSDFRSTLFARQKLEDNLTFEIVYRAEGEDEPDDDAPVYQVTLEFTGELNMSQLLDYSTSSSGGLELSQSQELLQALNIAVGHNSRTASDVVTVGRNLRVNTSKTQDRVSLGGGCEALRAFVFSARAATERVLLNVQIKNLPFLTPTSLPGLVAAYRQAGGAPHTLHPFLRLVSVEVTHIQRKAKSGKVRPRYKTILGLARKSDGKNLQHKPRILRDGAGAKDVEFWLDEPAQSSSSAKGKQQVSGGRYISVFDFFKKSKCHHLIEALLTSPAHGRTIADPSLPVVNVGTAADPSYLPLEVCQVKAGQMARGKISADQTKEMIKFAVRQPSANAKTITSVGLSLLKLERSDNVSEMANIVRD